MVALPVKMTSGGKFMPGFKVIDSRWEWQRAFREARVVQLGRVFKVCRAVLPARGCSCDRTERTVEWHPEKIR